MTLPLFLILFPLALAGVIALIGGHAPTRSATIKLGAIIVAIGPLILLAQNWRGDAVFFELRTAWANTAVLGAEITVTLALLIIGLRGKQLTITALTLIQALLMGFVEFGGHGHAEVAAPLFTDSFSIIMAHIVGVVGGLIVWHAAGYMPAYHKRHGEIPDRQRGFFASIFLFLGAMFALVFANHIGWLFLAWEVTTLCSFLLIGYSGTPEARKNAFLALRLNLIGGVAFAGALLYLTRTGGSLALNEIIQSSQAVALIPVALICFAGLTKAAQMPFSAWLLGAMVAPTPVSALLHASTMVKAGVYVFVRFAPVLQNTTVGLLFALIGATTFLLASCIAISQSNAKRVLAYSTIANLGLVVTCASVGNPQAVWAAILLIVFHAIAKALLFIAVGSTELAIGSRDIEDMEGLIARRPEIAVAILIGIAGMFLAPFGMLISKWAAIEALMNSHPILPIAIAFGSSATLFFWAKWMGKLLSTVKQTFPPPNPVGGDEKVALFLLSALSLGLCALWPVLSGVAIKPFLLATYGTFVEMNRGTILILSLMLLLVAALPLSLLYKGGAKLRITTPYLSGANVEDPNRFTGSIADTQPVATRGYYLAEIFAEPRLTHAGWIATLLLLAAVGVVVNL
ncbi:MAG: proton-conducting transporter membrane subunit [Kiritimatiellae bacterium]|nr:proton-conducting transporter membrane subunit [Kiritimatiellia bacterium]